MRKNRSRGSARLIGLSAALLTGICAARTGAAPLSADILEVMPERMLEHYVREHVPSDVALTGIVQRMTAQPDAEGAKESKASETESGSPSEAQTRTDVSDTSKQPEGNAASQIQRTANAVRISDGILDQVIFKIADPVPMHPESLVNIRSGPGTNYEVIGTVVATDRVMARNLINGWYMVDFRGLHGYISASLLYSWAEETG